MSKSGPIIYLVDDDEPFRAALRRLLCVAGYNVQSFASGSQFLASREPAQPGCVLADQRMPDGSGLDLQERLKQLEDPIPVILLSAHGDIPTTVRAIQSGAIDFLIKPIRYESLIEAIRRALERDALVRARIEMLVERRKRFRNLTPREEQVLRYVIAGRLNKETAAALGTGERTIKAHRASILRKLGVRSIAELVRFADSVGVRPVG